MTQQCSVQQIDRQHMILQTVANIRTTLQDSFPLFFANKHFYIGNP